jgi:hypothetical protein
MIPDIHPIADAPDWPLEKRVHYLEIALAKLWDQVWWMQLPEDRRKQYQAEGFTAPIANFYQPLDK